MSHHTPARALHPGPKVVTVPSFFFYLLLLLLMISQGWGGSTALYKAAAQGHQYYGFSSGDADGWEEKVLCWGRAPSWHSAGSKVARDQPQFCLWFCRSPSFSLSLMLAFFVQKTDGEPEFSCMACSSVKRSGTYKLFWHPRGTSSCDSVFWWK